MSGVTTRMDQPGALAGLIFVGVGSLGLMASRDLPFGNLATMGSGFMPRILASAILLIGIVTLARAFLAGKSSLLAPANGRAIFCVLAGVGGFALINAHLGYLAAATFLILLSAFARPGRRWGETLILTVVMCAATTLIFIVGLGVQLRMF